jgi:hypothetical protein
VIVTDVDPEIVPHALPDNVPVARVTLFEPGARPEEASAKFVTDSGIEPDVLNDVLPLPFAVIAPPVGSAVSAVIVMF